MLIMAQPEKVKEGSKADASIRYPGGMEVLTLRAQAFDSARHGQLLPTSYSALGDREC